MPCGGGATLAPGGGPAVGDAPEAPGGGAGGPSLDGGGPPADEGGPGDPALDVGGPGGPVGAAPGGPPPGFGYKNVKGRVAWFHEKKTTNLFVLTKKLRARIILYNHHLVTRSKYTLTKCYFFGSN